MRRKQHGECSRLWSSESPWLPTARIQDSKPGEVDLHGLYVKEAIRFTDKSIVEARARGDKQIHFIVGAYSLFLFVASVWTSSHNTRAEGKGLHSNNHIAKLKPAIEELMQKLVPPPPD